MALIECYKCGREINDQAYECVYCCCPLSTTLEKKYKITKCPECGTERKPCDTECYCGLIYENYKNYITRKRAAEIAKERPTETWLARFTGRIWGQV